MSLLIFQKRRDPKALRSTDPYIEVGSSLDNIVRIRNWGDGTGVFEITDAFGTEVNPIWLFAAEGGFESTVFGMKQIYQRSDASGSHFDLANAIIADDQGTTKIDWGLGYLFDGGGVQTVDWDNQQLLYSDGIAAVDWGVGYLNDTGDNWSVNFQARQIQSQEGKLRLDWQNYYPAQRISVAWTSNNFTATSDTNLMSTTIPTAMLEAGRKVRVRMRGRYSTTTGSNTVTIQVKLGSVAILTTGAVSLTASQTGQPFDFECDCILYQIGSSTGITEANGSATFNTSATVGTTTRISTTTTSLNLQTNPVFNLNYQWNNSGNTLLIKDVQMVYI